MGYDASAFESLLSAAVPSGGAASSDYGPARTGARPANTSGVRACCACKVYLDKQFEYPDNAVRQKHHSSSTRSGVLRHVREDKWGAEVLIDGAAKVIYVTTRIAGVNNTTDRSRAGNVPLSDEELSAFYPGIVESIRRVWNAGPFKFDITDDHCDSSYRIEFNPVFDNSNPHFTISFHNEPMEPNGRSSIGISTGTGTFNLGDPRSVKNSRLAKVEAHEYGHMLGLLDEYFEFEDVDGDGDGADLVEYQLGTTTRTGRVIQNAVPGVRLPLNVYEPSRFTYRWETDRGGMQYTWPAVTGLPPEASPDDKGFMGGMHERSAERKPYIITVVYAVIEVLEANGRKVTSMTVHN